MPRPRLFLSAVSQEWRSLRQRVARLLASQGYDCVSQDDFATGHGELRQWLREQIDGCEGLIQLVGEAYGAEPPEPDPTWGRVSYTQYEFLYARDQGKKNWVLAPGGDCVRDTVLDRLDAPDPADSFDPTTSVAWQAERHALQQAYRARLVASNHLRHEPQSEVEVDNAILKLRDELVVLRQTEEGRWRRVGQIAVAVGIILVAVVGGGWWKFHHLSADVQQVAAVTKEKIRAHLLTAIEGTHRRELAEADAPADWQERQRRREAATAAHVARLREVDGVVADFADLTGQGRATEVFGEMRRILAEQGVDEAIAFVAAQRPSLLDAARRRLSVAKGRNRAELTPLLLSAALDEARGKTAEARTVYRDVLAIEPDWPQALKSAFWFEIRAGERSLFSSGLSETREAFEEAKRIAERVDRGSRNFQWDRNLAIALERLGQVMVVEGDHGGAETYFRKAFRISESLVAFDPSNRAWRLDLAVGHGTIADVLEARGRGDAALDEYRQSLEILEKLDSDQPDDLEAYRTLSVTLNRIGDLLRGRGEAREAAAAYRRSLEVRKRGLEKDVRNPMHQRDLAINYIKIGDIAADEGEGQSALESYRASLQIAESLAIQAPTHLGFQRDLAAVLNRVGDRLMGLNQKNEALTAYRRSLGIVETLARADPANAVWQRDLTLGYGKASEALNDLGQSADALALSEKALEICRSFAASEPENTQWQDDMASLLDRKGDALLEQGYRRESLVAYREAKAIRDQQVLLDSSNLCLKTGVAASLSKFGSHPSFSVKERQAYLLRGRDLVVELRKANRLCPGGDRLAWFETALLDLEKHRAEP